MGVRGLRVDAAKHQDAGELKTLLSTLPSDMYIGQEVIGAAGEAVQPSMYTSIGQVSEFYYADNLDANVKTSGKMKYLETFGESWGMLPDASAVTFLDNHDTQRNGRAQLTYKSGALYTLANIFMLAWPYGNVRVMSSFYFPSSNTDQGPPSVGVENGRNCDDGQYWVCEHRRVPIANMVGWRNAVGTSNVQSWQNGDNANRIAFNRGNKGFIAMNRDGSASWSAKLQTGLPAGRYCNVIVSDDTASCASVTVASDGTASVTVPPLSAVALHVKKIHA
jgi:alpha-amylase